MTATAPLPPTDRPATDVPRPIDLATLGKLRELDPEGRNGIVRRVLTTYQHSLGQHLPRLLAAESAGDCTQLRALTHTLKSSSASVGALGLAALCAQAEALARGGELAPLTGVLARLHLEAQRVLGALPALLDD